MASRVGNSDLIEQLGLFSNAVQLSDALDASAKRLELNQLGSWYKFHGSMGFLAHQHLIEQVLIENIENPFNLT